MRRSLQRIVLVVALLAPASCLWRGEPTRPAPEPPPTPAVILVDPRPEPAPVPAAVAGMGVVRTVLSLGRGWQWQAEELLQEVHRTAHRDGQVGLEARALLLEAVLAWGREAADEALDLFRQAASVDETGAAGRGAQLALDTLIRLGEQERELERVRSRLAVAEKERDERAAKTQELVEEMSALRAQLDALKQVHLETESEKKDDPS